MFLLRKTCLFEEHDVELRYRVHYDGCLYVWYEKAYPYLPFIIYSIGIFGSSPLPLPSKNGIIIQLGDFKENMRYCKLQKEALDRELALEEAMDLL